MAAAYLRGPQAGPAAANTARPDDSGSKRLATLRAVAALAGFELRETADGDGLPAYQVTRWNLCKVLPDLDAVDAFLKRAGASTS